MLHVLQLLVRRNDYQACTPFYQMVWNHCFEKTKTCEFGEKEIDEECMEIYCNEVIATDNVSFMCNICMRFFKDSKLKGNWWSQDGKLQSYFRYHLMNPTKQKMLQVKMSSRELLYIILCFC